MSETAAQWYVVHTYSGYENKVATDLAKTVENNGLGDLMLDIQVPVEEVVEIKNGMVASKRINDNVVPVEEIEW